MERALLYREVVQALIIATARRKAHYYYELSGAFYYKGVKIRVVRLLSRSVEEEFTLGEELVISAYRVGVEKGGVLNVTDYKVVSLHQLELCPPP